jgi:hypothetical protein
MERQIALNTELWAAVSSADFAAVSRLIANGASLTDRYGKSLLHEAAFIGSFKILRLLVRAGCDPNVSKKPIYGEGCCGPTPLHYAARYNRTEIAEFLADIVDHIDVEDDQGLSSLQVAMRHGHFDVARVLIKAGAKSHENNGNVQRKLLSSHKNKEQNFRPISLKNMRPKRGILSSEFSSERRYGDQTDQNQFQSQNESNVMSCGYSEPLLPPIRPNHQLASHHVHRFDAISNFQNNLSHVEGAQMENNFDVQSAIHSSASSSQNVGNVIGTKSTIRQSKLFRIYESGNNVKGILGHNNLVWDIHKKQGAYRGSVYDASSI